MFIHCVVCTNWVNTPPDIWRMGDRAKGQRQQCSHCCCYIIVTILGHMHRNRSKCTSSSKQTNKQAAHQLRTAPSYQQNETREGEERRERERGKGSMERCIGTNERDRDLSRLTTYLSGSGAGVLKRVSSWQEATDYSLTSRPLYKTIGL